MTAPRWRWALLPAAIAVVVFRAFYWPRYGVDPRWNLVSALGQLAVTAGALVAWGRRPDSRVGPLLVAWGLYTLADSIGGHEDGVLLLLWWSAKPLYWVLLAHALLTYPAGRAATGAERWFLRAAYAMPLLYLAIALRSRPEWLMNCAPPDCPADAVYWHPSREFGATVILRVKPWLAAAFGLAFVVLLARRRRRATPAERRIAVPVWWATLGPCAAYLYSAALTIARAPQPWYDVYNWAYPIVAFGVPLALIAGLLTATLARADVASMLVRLRHTDVDALGPALATLLRDPTVDLAVPSPGGHVTMAGTPVTIDEGIAAADGAGPATAEPVLASADPVPAPAAPASAPAAPASAPTDPAPAGGTRRHATALGGGAFLLADPRTRAADPELFDAAVAAASVTLDNARLAAQVTAQLAEVTASRERLVRAADDERHRVERDLHDGAQQHLIGVGLALRSARDAVAADSPAAALLDEASDQLRASLAELRDLARGLRPPMLAERGLPVALDELCRRAGVTPRVDLPERPDPTVETAVYFVVAECLANAARHAPGAAVAVEVRGDASGVVVTVADDGPGGASTVGPGTGLRGLADRVAAAGGTFRVSEGPGTRVSAVFPR